MEKSFDRVVAKGNPYLNIFALRFVNENFAKLQQTTGDFYVGLKMDAVSGAAILAFLCP